MRPTADHGLARHAYVEEFIDSWNTLQPDAEEILDPSALPEGLRRKTRVLRKGYFWRAWLDEGRHRFVVMRLNRGRRVDANASLCIEAHFLDGSANVLSAGEWQRTPAGEWHLTDRIDDDPVMPRRARAKHRAS